MDTSYAPLNISYNPFDDADTDGVDPNATLGHLAVDQHPSALLSWMDRLADQSAALLITGPTGRGKTFAVHAVANELRQRGIRRQGIYGATERAHITRLTGGSDYWSTQIREAQLVVIDELGASRDPATSRASDPERAALRTLLTRHPSKSLLITTALSSSDITAIYGEDITSRIAQDITVIRYNGPDRRAPHGLDDLW